MRIVLAGIIGRYPWGGVTWCSLMYLLGLRALGHDVWYLEDTCECNYDPEINAIATDPSYALRYIHRSLAPFGFGDRWCYVDYTGRHHGQSEERMREVCSSADLFLVLSGGCWVWRDHYLNAGRKAFIDSDPAFTQIALKGARRAAQEDEKKRWYVDFFEAYDCHFTFGSNIGGSDCDVPPSGLQWLPTWQPIDTDLWNPAAFALPPRRLYTTVMTWKIESFEDIGGNKDVEFLKILDLPKRMPAMSEVGLELAVSGPRRLLEEKDWPTVDALTVSSDLWRYHSYVGSSRAEFSVAKHTYVSTRSGWFSDRTECYLATGRPAVVQDTGFSRHLPTGEGLFAWNTLDEAVEAIETVESDYSRHAAAARRLACEHFDSSRVLDSLITRIP